MADGAHQEKPINLFYSYSHRDEELRKKLEDHLAALRWSGMIAEWHDRNIEVGDEWAKEIDRNLSSADIILLLVSSSFIASEYCWSVEMKKALERHGKGEAKVIPVILRPCSWRITPFAKLQAAPTDAKPVTSWSDPDEALYDVARKIEHAVTELQQRRRRAAEQAQQQMRGARKRQVTEEQKQDAQRRREQDAARRAAGAEADVAPSERRRTLDDFRERKAHLFSAYDQIARSDILPVGPLTTSSVEAKRQALVDERFIVAVCGQIKAGKSTLLNALIFGREVLPSDVTVITAKVTTLRYAEEEGFKVEFYSTDEWRRLQTSYESQGGNIIQKLEQDVGDATRRGEPPSKYITWDGSRRRYKGFEELVPYVAVPELGGFCSPYVKQITGYHCNKRFSAVDIVDTPGLNDPNEIRARITKDWIHNASAVLYVSVAGRVMDNEDLKFIDEYLLGVPSTHRILVVNRIDGVSDDHSVKSYIDRLRHHPDPRIRGVLSPPNLTVYVSSLGALIGTMLKRGDILDEEMQERREILQGPPDWTAAENHGFARLQGLIEERLIANKGEGLIAEHKAFVQSIFEQKRRELLAEEAHLKEIRFLRSYDREGLLAKGKQIEEKTDAIGQANTQFAEAVKRARIKQVERLRQAIENCSKDIAHDFEEHLEQQLSLADLWNKSPWYLKKIFEEKTPGIYKAINQAQIEIEAALKDDIGRFRSELIDLDLLLPETVGALTDVGVSDAFSDIRVEFRQLLSRKRAQELVVEGTNAWQRFFNTQRGRKRASATMFGATLELLDREFDTLCDKVEDIVGISVEKMIKRLEERMADAISRQKREIDILLKQDLGYVHEIAGINDEIKSLYQRLSLIDDQWALVAKTGVFETGQAYGLKSEEFR